MSASRVARTADAVDFASWMAQVQRGIEAYLAAQLPSSEMAPQQLHQAMRYAVLDGGKRVRPLLVYAAGALRDAPADALASCAGAVELMHAYSLVHDDMPCMDDDALRRGKPTVHKQYGEALALLAGDALQTHAFALLAQAPINDAARQLRMVRVLADAAGAAGMCGGQAIDLASVGQRLTRAQLEQMHQLKTGALLRAAVWLGACCGGNLSAADTHALDTYAGAVGLAFQVIDDVLDATADSSTLGKTAGTDAAAHKPTYVSILGLQPSHLLARQLCATAHDALVDYGSKAQRLHDLADLVVQRSN
jgi:farnesyl diphosphate synthase